MKKCKEYIKNPKTIIIIIAFIVLGILVPFVINEIFKYGSKYGGYKTLWTAAEAILYYGTIIGSVATIMAVVMTINYTKESNEKDRAYSNKINHRNMGIQVILDFVDSCDPMMVYPILHKIKAVQASQEFTRESVKKDIEIIKKEFIEISDKVRKCYIKFQMLYPSLSPEIDKYIKNYVDKYRDETSEITNNNNYEDYLFYYAEKYPEFLEKLRDLTFNYERDE